MGADLIPTTVSNINGNVTIKAGARFYWDGTNAELYYAADIHGAGRDALIISVQDTLVIAAGANGAKNGYIQMGTSSGTYEYFLWQHNGAATVGTQTPGSKKFVFGSYYWNGSASTYRAMAMRHKTSAAGVGTMDYYAGEPVGATTGETDAGTHFFSIREGEGVYFPTGYGITYADGNTIRTSGGRVQISGQNVPTTVQLIRTSDLSRNTTTSTTADDVLSTSVAAGTYRLTVSLIFNNASATPGSRVAFAFSGTATTASGVARYGAHGGVNSASVYPNPSDATIFAPTFTSTNTNSTLTLEAILVVTVTGTLSVNWAQQTSSGDNTTLKAGSHMVLQRVA